MKLLQAFDASSERAAFFETAMRGAGSLNAVRQRIALLAAESKDGATTFWERVRFKKRILRNGHSPEEEDYSRSVPLFRMPGTKGGDMRGEQRRERRHDTKEGAIGAFFPITPEDSFLLGQIIDISESGLALRYFTNGNHSNPPPRLDIFGSSHPLIYIDNVPGKIVYDFEVLNIPGSNFKVRRCGVQFGDLSEKQLFQLQYFMSNYSSYTATDNPPYYSEGRERMTPDDDQPCFEVDLTHLGHWM